MSDNKNIELNDEMMAKATGGVGEANAPTPKYKVGAHVTMSDDPGEGVFTIVSVDNYYSPKDGWLYTIKPNSGLYPPIQYFENFLLPA